MTILFAAFCMSFWLHTSGVMQDKYAHLLLTLQQQCPLLRVSVMSSVYICEGVIVDLPEQQECQLSVSDLPFPIAFTVLAAFELRGIFTDSPMATGAFMTLGSVLTFSHFMHSLVSQGLVDVGVEAEVDSAKVLLLK